MDGFPSGQRGQTVNLLQIASVVRIHLHPFSFSGIFSKKRTYHIQHNIAGWSSLEARRAHNPKVIGSNPIPATLKRLSRVWQSFLLYRKFLKSSEIVYNRLEIKNDIAKERRGLRHDVVYEVFCFGLG